MSGIAAAAPAPTDCIVDSRPPVSVCTCRKCGETKPIEAFRITSKRTGKRDTRCRKCYNAYASMMARRYNAKRRERRRRKLAGALADARNRRTFEEIGNGLIDACGGFEEFVSWWHLHMRATMRAKPGSKHANRLFDGVMNLILLGNGLPSLASMDDHMRRGRSGVPKGDPIPDSEEPARDFSQMSNEELHAILREEQEAREPRGRGRSTAGV